MRGIVSCNCVPLNVMANFREVLMIVVSEKEPLIDITPQSMTAPQTLTMLSLLNTPLPPQLFIVLKGMTALLFSPCWALK